MNYTDIPGFIVLPFADSGGKTTIPVTTATPGRASLTDGFPALTRTPIASGGIPPDGTDMNGILFEVSGMARWSAAGGPVTYDSAFSTAVGGYPRGSVLTNTSYNGQWLCTINNNTNDPDASGANWMNLVRTKTTITATGSLSIRNLGIVLVDATAGNITVTLPGHSAAIGIPLYFEFVRVDTTANTVTISRSGSNMIEGLVSMPLAVGNRISLMSDGVSAWSVLSATAGQGMQVFTGSGTFTVPAGVYRIRVTNTGGGGGGAGCGTGNSGNGGGAGGTAIGFYGVTPGQTISVTIGAAGTAGISGGGNGGNGGTTSFGSLCSATGGQGGTVGAGASGGGTGTGGQINIGGGDGTEGAGLTSAIYAGAGGASFWGGGGRGGDGTVGGGLAGKAYGSGGGGSYNNAGPGGAGKAGCVLVEWF